MTTHLGLTVESRERHERFLERALASGSVYHLGRKSKDGFFWAESSSNGDENGRGAGKVVVPVWSGCYAPSCVARIRKINIKNPRRVLHFEYSSFQLPDGIAWAA